MNVGSYYVFISAFGSPKVNALSRIGPHPLIIVDYLIGLLLSDASLSKRGGPSITGSRLIFEQSLRNVDFFMQVHAVFERHGYCGAYRSRERIGNLTPDVRTMYAFNSYTFSSWNWIYDLFYDSERKRHISPDLVNYLTPRALAVWIMGDGTYQREGLVLCTDGFTHTEVELLCSMLRSRFDLVVKVTLSGKKHPRIRIMKDSMPQLKSLVVPHMHPSMHYKLGIGRTTC